MVKDHLNFIVISAN